MNKKRFTTGFSRRNFLKKASVFSIGTLGLHNGISALHLPESANEKVFGFKAHPVLTNVRPDEIEIIVAPDKLAAGWIEYGETPNLHQKTTSHHFGRYTFSDRVIRFKIKNLEPGKKYFYRVHLHHVEFHTNRRMERTTEAVSDVYSFRTLDPDASSASFACWNDTHENDETLARLTERLNEQTPDFMIWNGDVTNDIFREEQIVGQFLNPGGQAYATTVPVMLARGNHDVRGQDAPYLEDYMTGPDGFYHFGFRQGPLACLVLDTGEDKPDDHEEYGGLADFAAYRSMQAEWLEQVIEEEWFKSAPFRVAFMHIPLVWDGSSRYRIWDGKCMGWICEDAYTKWHDLLEKAGLHLVISGHTHRYRFIPPDEKRSYGQLIGGGPQPERATCITGRADRNRMTIDMTDLDGNLLERITYTA